MTPDIVVTPAALAVAASVFILLLIALVYAMAKAARSEESARQQREGEFRLRTILETTQEGFAQIDRAQRLQQANPAFCAMLGRSRAEVIGHPIADFFTPGSIQVFAAEMEKCAAGPSSSCEVTVQRPDGTLRQCRFNGSPIRDQHGERIGSFALVTDITDLIANDAYVRRAVALFENAAEGVVMTDARGSILSVNPAFERITGYSEAEVLGQTPGVLKSGRHEDGFYGNMWAELLAAGSWQGEIWNRRKNGETYPEWLSISAVRGAAGAVQGYIGVFSDISHIKRSAAELERLAHYDPLTELANRLLLGAQLQHALERAARYGDQLVVMEIDLDGFKNVNDTLGHPAGDRLLQIVAGRLREVLRGEDIVARLGGDEFAVVMESVAHADHAALVADKIIAAIAEPLQLDGQNARVTASIGIALYPADGGDDIALLKAADTALYVAKREGRNTYRFYDPGMSVAVHRRHDLEQGLRHALEHGELELWYQPQLALASGRLAGVEALVRWRHPERGLVSPADFLPIASDTGLIVPLGEWVLRAACRQMRDWLAAGLEIGRVAVNVDGQQIMRSDFITTVSGILAETGLSAERLELEITEGFLLENAENGMGTVALFSEMGVDVAIDDFGTGYSSLAYLKYLKADSLKIDRSFLIDLPDNSTGDAIVRAVVGLGHGLGFTLVAEGVETAEQLDYLRSVGCDVVQGYHFARPMPAGELADWVRAGKAATLLSA